MSLFVVFIFGAVLLGAGGMLSPAWNTAQPRIGLCATFCLALITGGAVFTAEAFGWDTLIIDYMLFALLSGVVLGGTLSTAQARAEARGETLADRELGWPGPEDLCFFALVALIVITPLFHLTAPLGEQGQLAGFHSLAIREGQSFNSLAPFARQTQAVLAPGFHALSAYLSLQLDHSIPLIQLSIAAAVMFLLVWLAYDFGAELLDKRLGRAMAIAQLLCLGAPLSSLDGHFSEMLALLFMGAFLLYALRILQGFKLADAIAGGLMMGAVIYTNLSLSLVMLYGFLPLLALAWFSRKPSATPSSRLCLTLGLPFVALLGIAPWLINTLPLLPPPSPSPFAADIGNLAILTRDQGFVIVPLALYGIWRGLRSAGPLRQISLLMLAWLILVIDAALFGLLSALIPGLGNLSNAPNIARHGIILPYAFFAGLALLRLWEERIPAELKRSLRASCHRLLALAAGLIVLIGISFQPILEAARPIFALPPETLSHDDLAAMIWLRENAPADALLLAADGNAWLPVFAERQALDFRAARYFEWDFLARNDASADEIDYVFVPPGGEAPADLRLSLAFEQNGARVFVVTEN